MMKLPHPSKITVIISTACAVLILGTGTYFVMAPESEKSTVATAAPDNLLGWKFPITKFPLTGSDGGLAYSDIRDPGGIPQGLPVRLKIPIIGVDSAIEDALITSDGRMDVPSGSKNVAWFSLGPHPGQVGSAVIGGHFGISNGVPFVFYKLDKLKVGDKVYIEDDNDDTLTFVVRSIALFDRNADATTVFTSSDGVAHLNLITCEGIWNRVNDTYPERRVIFTDAVPTTATAAPAPTIPATPASNSNAPVAAAFSRSLSIGANGADVIALQTILEKKGFLAMPQGIAKGFFGVLTSVGVARYQTSVGLPSIGIFGPLTRAKITSEGSPLTLAPEIPEAPAATLTTALNVLKTPSFPQTFLQSTQGLYSTPQDALITLLLLLTIAAMAFAIIEQRKHAT